MSIKASEISDLIRERIEKFAAAGIAEDRSAGNDDNRQFPSS